MNAREVARRALRRIDGGGFATAVLADEATRARLDDRDRRLAAEIVHGVSRYRSRIDRALEAATRRPLSKTKPRLRVVLRVGAYQLLFLDRVPAHAAVDDAVRAARRVGGARIGGFVNGVLRRIAREGEPPVPGEDEPRRFAEVACALPPWIVDELERAVGREELAAAAAALARPAPLVIRANALRGDRAAVTARLAADHPDIEIAEVDGVLDALAVTGLGAPDRSPSFAEGLWTVQDAGAQRVARALAPAAGQRLLDACAGVGGKATHLAELSGDAATIDAVDLSETKLSRLRESCERLGITSVHPRVADLTDEGALDADYDGVLLDAPCSGLGVLRRHPEAAWRVQPDDVDRLAELQARLLDTVAARVRRGGVLVYSVCTFTEREGPAQVAAFVDRHRDFSVEVDERTWPHRDGADAFFLARLGRAR